MTSSLEGSPTMSEQTSRPRFRLGAIYPDDAWVDSETQALIDDFRSFVPQEVELISAATARTRCLSGGRKVSSGIVQVREDTIK